MSRHRALYGRRLEPFRRNLAVARIQSATVIVGDGTLGLARHAPFHGIVVAAAAPEIPAPLADTSPDGRQRYRFATTAPSRVIS